MNVFSSSIYGSDRITQTVALLAGATAQSYNAVGLQMQQTAGLQFDSTVVSQYVDSGSGLHSVYSDTPVMVANTLATNSDSVSGPIPSMLVSNSEDPEKLAELATAPAVQGADLMSDFEVPSPDILFPSNLSTWMQSSPNTELEAVADGLSAVISDVSLLTLLDPLLDPVQPNQEGFSDSFQGKGADSVQGLIDGLIEAAGTPIGSLALPVTGEPGLVFQDDLPAVIN